MHLKASFFSESYLLMRCHVDGDSAASKGYVSVYLIAKCRLDSTTVAEKDVSFSVVARDRTCSYHCSFHKPFPFSQGWGFDRFISRDQLLDPGQGFFGADGSLTINCRIHDPFFPSVFEVGRHLGGLLAAKVFWDVEFSVGRRGPLPRVARRWSLSSPRKRCRRRCRKSSSIKFDQAFSITCCASFIAARSTAPTAPSAISVSC